MNNENLRFADQSKIQDYGCKMRRWHSELRAFNPSSKSSNAQMKILDLSVLRDINYIYNI